MCFCEDVVLELVGGRGEGGIVNFVGFCTFRSGFRQAENSVKMTSKFRLVQFVRELPRTFANARNRPGIWIFNLQLKFGGSRGPHFLPFFQRPIVINLRKKDCVYTVWLGRQKNGNFPHPARAFTGRSTPLVSVGGFLGVLACLVDCYFKVFW